VTLQLDNVRLLTDDFAAAFAFYADGVGLPVLYGTAEGPYAELSAGTASIGIAVRDQMPGVDPTAPAGDRAVLVLEAEPLDETLAELRARGIDVEDAVDRRAWGIRVTHLRDPDGRLLELFEPIQPSGPQQH
jgi:catechol 2,3-dioxygenase-like lactoylglutathione lyase family enzyme